MPLTKVTGDNIDNSNFSIGITTATSITATNLIGTNLNISGVSTQLSTTLIGTGTSTGTASQTLQVTGGGYISGNLGIGATNSGYKLQIAGASGNAVLSLIETGVRNWGVRAGGTLTNTFDICDFTANQKIGRAHV